MLSDAALMTACALALAEPGASEAGEAGEAGASDVAGEAGVLRKRRRGEAGGVEGGGGEEEEGAAAQRRRTATGSAEGGAADAAGAGAGIKAATTSSSSALAGVRAGDDVDAGVRSADDVDAGVRAGDDVDAGAGVRSGDDMDAATASALAGVRAGVDIWAALAAVGEAGGDMEAAAALLAAGSLGGRCAGGGARLAQALLPPNFVGAPREDPARLAASREYGSHVFPPLDISRSPLYDAPDMSRSPGRDAPHAGPRGSACSHGGGGASAQQQVMALQRQTAQQASASQQQVMALQHTAQQASALKHSPSDQPQQATGPGAVLPGVTRVGAPPHTPQLLAGPGAPTAHPGHRGTRSAPAPAQQAIGPRDDAFGRLVLEPGWGGGAASGAPPGPTPAARRGEAYMFWCMDRPTAGAGVELHGAQCVGASAAVDTAAVGAAAVDTAAVDTAAASDAGASDAGAGAAAASDAGAGSDDAGAPILIAIMAGEAAEWVEGACDEEVVGSVLRGLRALFGPAGVPPPTRAHVTRWRTDRLSRGAYSFLPPGASGAHYDLMVSGCGWVGRRRSGDGEGGS